MTRERGGSDAASRRVTREAPAKVNLWLRILGRDADGYHRLDTALQTLALADRVTVGCRPAQSVVEPRLVAGGAIPVTSSSDNLCLRAARAYLERWPAAAAIDIELDKQVPVAAGLGGGSSDAAAVLLALRELLGAPAQIGELREPARGLGADVPFFLVGGTARGSGRGDVVEPLPDLEPSVLWLVAPEIEVSTAQVFAAHAARATAGSAARVVAEPPGDRSLGSWMLGNDLEQLARTLFPEVDHIYTVLKQFCFSSVQLSGSGGVVFGIPREGVHLDEIERALNGVGKLLVTETRSRSACAI